MPDGPDYTNITLSLPYPCEKCGTQLRETRVFHPCRALVLVASGPVVPGAEGLGGEALGQLLEPDCDWDVTICPCGHLVGVSKLDLVILHRHARGAERLANLVLAILYLLLRA